MAKLSSMYSSFVVVSLSLQATFLLGASWNNLSITLYMFKTVSSSFFSSFLCFTPVIGAFIYSFYRTNNEPSNNPVTYYSEEDSQNKSSEKNFNNFHSVWDASIKTLVMTTGEFEAANIDFDCGKWLLFVAFLFIAPIVILNLINGLAVSDIVAIRQESEFISVCKRVKLLERYERAVVNFRSLMRPEFLQRFFRDPWFPGSFFESYESMIYIKTNELNKLSIQKKKAATSTSSSNNNNGSINTANQKDASGEKNDFQPIPFFPIIPSSWLRYYFGVRTFEWAPFLSLDQCCIDKAKTIAKSQSKNSPARGTQEPVDSEQTARPASKKEKITFSNQSTNNVEVEGRQQFRKPHFGG